ncbi:DUF2169 domain-containing protein [Polyangium aurulentum]|uniref:DUF2169 domain-containing protein n=1 Tax=Polyangium aurulentum TaxID=2567896 RepID=UPI00146D0C63|nr:DUF2169 domain-containing protein [Polyangium aurulentum]UQA54602.1 DUF2169 domain-containing protein [Polyangium aurulentum]
MNSTPLPSVLIPNAEAGDDMTALVVCAATFTIAPVPEGKEPQGPTLQLARVQRPVEMGYHKPEPADDHFVRSGVSVTASGHVHAPGGKATKADATLSVGSETRVVRAFGPRVWREGMFGVLSPTSPLPFDRVPMTWELAYGGAVSRKTTAIKHEGRELIAPEHPVAYPQNAEGTGFYFERADAVEKPLPQLEHPDMPIRAWDDRPHPVCFAPYALRGGMRPMSLMTSDEKVDFNRVGRLTARAAPWLVFNDVAPGTPIALRGMRPRGETLAFLVPEVPVSVRVILGPARFRMGLRLDTVDIDADAALVRFVYRVAFTYALIQHEIRETYLEPTNAFPKLPPP